MTRSSSPEISPSITMLEPMMVLAMWVSLSDVIRQLHVHLDGPVEDCPVFDHHARRLDVAVHLRARVDGDPRARVDVARSFAVDGQLIGANVRLDLAGSLDGEVILQRDLPFDASLDDEVPAA